MTTAATFGDSNEIQVTEDVVAIGNPRGINFQNSVTKGIVSALNREASATNNAKFIQIDAPINPGNSGGPLCNMYGVLPSKYRYWNRICLPTYCRSSLLVSVGYYCRRTAIATQSISLLLSNAFSWTNTYY